MNIHALEAEILRQQIFGIAIMAIAFGVSAWVSYLVIRAAIRDGIKESGLLEALRHRKPSTQSGEPEEPVFSWTTKAK